LSLSLLNGFKLLKVKQLTDLTYYYHNQVVPHSASQSLWLPGWLEAINSNTNSLFLTIGPGDFLVHHAIALGLHTTLTCCALDARGSKLMPDKRFWL
jgi:hypothetical protein